MLEKYEELNLANYVEGDEQKMIFGIKFLNLQPLLVNIIINPAINSRFKPSHKR